MTDVFRLLPVACLMTLLVVSGCRTYGNERYGSEADTYAAIQQTTEQMERHLSRAESDLRQLQTAAERNDTLQTFVKQYESVITSHRGLVEEHERQVADLTADASYRTLHRVYGAMITDQRLLEQNYRRTLRGIWAAVRDTTIPRHEKQMPSRYNVTPVQFPRVQRRGELTMADALRGLGGARGIQRPEREAGE